MKGQVIKTMLINFLIWLIPTALLMVLFVLIILILMLATADFPFSNSSKKDPFEKWPKGLIGSLGIGFLLTALTSIGTIFYYELYNVDSIVYLSFISLSCFCLAYWGIKYDYKRIKKNLEAIN